MKHLALARGWRSIVQIKERQLWWWVSCCCRAQPILNKDLQQSELRSNNPAARRSLPLFVIASKVIRLFPGFSYSLGWLLLNLSHSLSRTLHISRIARNHITRSPSNASPPSAYAASCLNELLKLVFLFCEGKNPSINIPKCFAQRWWCAWWKSNGTLGWSVHWCLRLDLIKHLITFPFTPIAIWPSSVGKMLPTKISTKSFSSLPSIPYGIFLFASPQRGNLKGLQCCCFGETFTRPSLPPKIQIDQLDRDSAGFMCVFSPHWSASERK